MNYKQLFQPFVPVDHLKVWVLVPSIETSDENLNYYYDFEQSFNEYKKCFEALKIQWQWQLINLKNYKEIIKKIQSEKMQGNFFPIVFNLCDGDEINDSPGISIIKELDNLEIIYTGADAYFYEITTSKIQMKKAFDLCDICTPNWEILDNSNLNQPILDKLTIPIIVKPAVSGGSLGVGVKNVVYNIPELITQYKKITEGYHGWNLGTAGVIAESFIIGKEFTTFIVGSYTNPSFSKIYTPVERVFHKSLPKNEQFLSFDRLWEIYEHESAMPNEDNFFEYELPDSNLIEPLKKLSWDAYKSVKGVGYTRIDIRLSEENNTLYVLEVNAQCGISEDENFTSIGAILKASNISFEEMVIDIINDAFIRRKIKNNYEQI